MAYCEPRIIHNTNTDPDHAWNVQLWTSTDFGRNYYYSGNGRYFDNQDAAERYAAENANPRIIQSSTDGTHVYMALKLDGKYEEVDRYAGADHSWNHYKTTGDGDQNRREAIIAAFNELY